MSARLARIKARLEKTIQDMDAILEKADTENRELTAEEQGQFDSLKKGTDRDLNIIKAEEDAITLDAKVKGIKIPAVDPVQEKKADPVEEKKADTDPVDPLSFRKKDTKGLIKMLGSGPSLIRSGQGNKVDFATMIGVTACGIVRAKALPDLSIYEHIDALGFGEVASQLYANKVKALSTTGVGSGAEVMPESFSTDFIAYLRPMSSILRAGPTRIDLSTGNLRIPGGNVGATAAYRVEGTDIAYTEPTFREIDMQAKNLSAITAINNELLQRSPLAVAEIIRQEMATAYVLAMDYAGLRGDGSSDGPEGLKSLMHSDNVFDASSLGSDPTVAQIDVLAVQMINAMRQANIPTLRLTWFMNSTTALYLATLRGANGEKIYPTMEGDNPRFWGHPVIVSNQIPSDLGDDTNESEIYLCDMGHFWMGETGTMTLDVSSEASYVTGGNLVSAFSRNQQVIRLVGAHDFELRYDKAACMAEGVTWGTPA